MMRFQLNRRRGAPPGKERKTTNISMELTSNIRTGCKQAGIANGAG